MRVTFHGVRGSVPSPGPSTARYGGNTSCVEVVLADGATLVLDAGTGLRRLGAELLASDRFRKVHLLLSHTHWDHVLGLPFFGPLWRSDSEILVYPLPTDAQERFQRTIFDDIHFPVSANDIPARVAFEKPSAEPWRIGSAMVRRVVLNHPGQAQGFRIDDDGGASLVYLTDNELSRCTPAARADLARFAEGADLLVHDAQYLPTEMPAKRGWGHSVVDDVLELGLDSSSKRVALFHHDPDRSDDDLDQIGESSKKWLRERGSEAELVVAVEGMAFDLPGGR